MSKQKFDAFIQYLDNKNYAYTVHERRETLNSGEVFVTYFVSVSLFEKKWIKYFDTLNKFHNDIILYCQNAEFPLFTIEILGNEWSAIHCSCMVECYTEQEEDEG